jgi:hypothetical protein
MANDPPKQVLDGLEALRARRALHASHQDARPLRVASGVLGPDRKPFEAAGSEALGASSAKVSALMPQP